MNLNDLDDLKVYWKSSEDMAEVEEKSVNSVITSPPYWKLKDYNHHNQIGTADESYDQYHARMKNVWSECYEVLSDDGTMWIVADTHMDKGDLRQLPYHISQRAEDVGFILQDIITWFKPTAIAGMTEKNVVNKKEYIIYLSKSKDYKFNHESSQNGVEDPAVSEDHQLGNLWRHPVKRGSVGQEVLHKAPYPVSLINRVVKISTDPNDTVLDPFFGSGTTAVSAISSGRSCIGYEINNEFESVVQERIQRCEDIQI